MNSTHINSNFSPVVIMSASQMMTKSLLQKTPISYDESAAPSSFSLLRSVIEGFSDGILILTPSGEPLHINRRGLQLCRQINPDDNHQVPEPIWTLCQYLVESQQFYSDRPVMLSKTILTPAGEIRARVQWYQVGEQADSCLMVNLEDQAQAAKTAALFEARQFNLTERETEVWVLRKANRSYEEIARELYIAINTVKRHLKSIYAKRKQVEDLAQA